MMTTTPPSEPPRPATGSYAVTLDRCDRWFGPARALSPVSLRVAPGAVCAVTGANGSGKTTLLRMVAGLLTPTSGTRTARGRALYVAAGAGARSSQRVGEAVAFAAALAGGPADVGLAIRIVGLHDMRDVRVATLSAGQRSLVTLAVALAAGPAIAGLDEPEAHLDDRRREIAADVVGRLASAGTAVVVATHDLRWLTGRVDAQLELSTSASAAAAAVDRVST